MVKRTIEQTIINESIRRMQREAEEEIRSGKITMLTNAPDFVRRIVEPMVPLIITLSRIALLSKWN